MSARPSIPPGIEAVSVLVGGDQTDGGMGLVDETLSPAFDGPPLHVHPGFAVTPAGFGRYFRLLSAALTGTEPSAKALGPRPATEMIGPPIPRSWH